MPRLQIVLLTLYLLVIGFVVHAHAMWRDEIQAWLIARDSPDLPALFHNLHYEGHPALWYLLLMPLTRLSRDPVLMQLLHVAIAGATVAVVLWRAPLSIIEKVLFPFGYYMVFEYAVKSRSYALGCLLIVTLCAVWGQRHRHPLLIASLLALMANVHIMLMVISVAFVVALIADRLTDGAELDRQSHASWRFDVLAMLVIGAGWGIAVATALPPPDLGYLPSWFIAISRGRLQETVSTLGFMLSADRPKWATIAAIGILVIALVRTRENPVAASFLGAAIVGLLSFFYIRVPAMVWHAGLLFMVLVASVWIDRISAPTRRARPLVPAAMFCALLLCQVANGLVAVQRDLRQPLSSGRDVARFIVNRGWERDPVIGMLDYTTTTVVGYLGIDRAYYVNARRWGSFTVWDKQREQKSGIAGVLDAIVRMGPEETLVASDDTGVSPTILRSYGFLPVAQFEAASVPDENYTVYRRSAAGGR
jgi:hypothetical protein